MSEIIRKLLYKLSPSYRAAIITKNKLTKEIEILQKQIDGIENKLDTQFWLNATQPGETMEETKKRVFMQMPSWGGNMSKCQRGSGYILREFKKICEENNLVYWLIGGTLLGAVRHGGFIPWDDDVDVAMDRKSFEKLLEILEGNDIFFCKYGYRSKGKKYPIKVAKISMKVSNCPFFMDIFIHDYAGNSNMSEDEIWSQITALRNKAKEEIYNAKGSFDKDYSDDFYPSEKDKNIFENAYNKALSELPDVTVKEFVYRGVDQFTGEWNQLMPYNRIFPLGKLEFEGEFYDVPKDYDWYLKLKFQDYYKLPTRIGFVHSSFSGDNIEYADEIIKKFDM